MNNSSSISRRINSCLEAFSRKDYETSLIHFFPALDKTAKRRRPKEGVGARIKQFIADQEAIITALATGNIIVNINANGVSFPEAIYKFGRNSIAHEGELDERLKITNSGSIMIGDIWILPSSYILGMTIAVMVVPENATERLDNDGTVHLLGQDWQLNDLWGAEQRLKAHIATVFRSPDLFDRH